MTAFVDTSAFVALMDADETMHPAARKAFEQLLSDDTVLITSNYVLLETCALIQRRIGMKALKSFHDDLLPLITIKWIDETTHHSGMNTVLSAGRKKLSLVDCVSFDMMRMLGIKTAYAFDRHFKEQGFILIPDK
jgi:predicted nucleic acid-binding protein